MSSASQFALLQDRIRRIERPNARRHGVLPFGVTAIDRALPGGGLALGALHELHGEGADEEDGAAAAGFAAGIAARLFAADSPQKQQNATGLVLWCLKHDDLYGPGLVEHGLDPARVAMVRAARDDDILWVLEEGLRTPGVAAVIGEICRLPMVAGRRLQLAAENSGAIALVLRRWRSGAEAAAERKRPSAAVTRWRIASVPSLADSEPGIGQPCWRVELLRCRSAEPATWITPVDLGVADASDPIHPSAELADRPAAPQRFAAEPQIRRAG